MREQLTFYDEPVAGTTPVPAGADRAGFVFGKDVGGDEFSQLHWFDLDTRQVTRLTDGKRSQNNGALFSPDGRTVLTSIVRLNGDLWLLEGLQPERAPARAR